MEFTYKFVGKLTTLTDTANHLRETSQPFLEDCLAKGGLYNLLTLPKSTIPNPLLSKLLEYYNPISNTFSIQGNELGITLEDVLFLARIRIDGTPVLVKDYNDNHCRAIFDEAIDDIDRLHKIINDTSLDEDKRKAALLMLIVQCAIMSSHHGNHFYPALFEVLSDPDGTCGTYAWGAAMLAFLQHHLQKINELKQLKKPEIKIGGCGWLLLCFFFVRIPSLWDVIGLTDVRKEMEAGQLVQHPFPMRWILEKLAGSTLGKDQRGGYLKKMNPVFDSLKDEEICWTPYTNWVLPDELKKDKQFVTRLGPIFCNNYVVHHKPHLVTKQLGCYELDQVMDSDKLKIFHHRIRFVDDRGSNGHDYFDKYEKELILWEKKVCINEVHDNDGSDGDPPRRPCRQRRNYGGIEGARRSNRVRQQRNPFTPTR